MPDSHASAARFEEIAAIVDRSPVAARQLVGRARRRVRAATAATGRESNPRREIVAACFAASREGRLDALIQLLAPGVVLRADGATVRMGAAPEVLGARAVAETFSGRARAARLASIDGQYDAVWAPGGKPRVVFRFAVEGDTIVAINLIADPDVTAALNIATVDGEDGRGSRRGSPRGRPAHTNRRGDWVRHGVRTPRIASRQARLERDNHRRRTADQRRDRAR